MSDIIHIDSLRPSAENSFLIRNFFWMRSTDACDDLKVKITSDGNCCLFFNFGLGILLSSSKKKKRLPECFIGIPFEKYKNFTLCTPADSLLVVCNMSVFARLFNLHPKKLVTEDDIIIADAVIPNSLWHKMKDATFSVRAKIFEDFISEKTAGACYQKDTIDHIYDDLYAGVTDNITQICKRNFITGKTLCRKFTARVGLTPKSFTKVMRIKKLLANSNAGYKAMIGKIADDAGYFDHSHLIHDFESFLDQSPGSYFTNEHPVFRQFLGAE